MINGQVILETGRRLSPGKTSMPLARHQQKEEKCLFKDILFDILE